MSELRYKPWGSLRYASQPTTTGLRFTGQRAEGIGLYDYGARWYDSSLGRFASPDSIVPLTSQSVQAWDRYAYVNNNPVNVTDPTGHIACWDGNFDSSCNSKDNNPYGFKDPGGTQVSKLSPDSPKTQNQHHYEPNPNNYFYGYETNFHPDNVDWIDVGINVIGIAGDIGLITTLVGNVEGPGEWLVTEGVEFIGIAYDANKFVQENDPQGLSKDIILQMIKETEAGKLFPGVGLIFDLKGLSDALTPGYKKEPVYGPPPVYRPAP